MPTVVIIDDVATNRAIYSRVTRSIQGDIRVQAFETPLKALAWLNEHDADLIIADYKMPGMNGADFVRRFRAHEHRLEIPVVVITAYDDREFRWAALEAGATDFLHSPVDHSEFQTRVRNLLKLSLHQKIVQRRADALAEELKQSQLSRDQALRDSRERLAQVIDTIPAMISATDREGHCIFVSAYMAALGGLNPAEVLDHELPALFGEKHQAYHLSLDKVVLQSGEVVGGIEENVVDRYGNGLTFITTKSPLRSSTGEINGVLTTSLDITDRKRAETRLAYLAHHDHLTTLPNRAFLHDRLEEALARTRSCHGVFALFFIDLDRFKSVNDGLGHFSGDLLLRAVSDRLRRSVCADDIVVRLGGDEFAVLQTRIADPEDAAAMARRINDVLDEPFVVGGREITMNASIGIALHPKDGETAEELLQNADLAMYRVKVSGRRGYQFFSRDMLTRAQSSISLQSDLRRAIADNQLVLYYQPQINLKTGNIIGAEALVRWRRPDGEVMLPAAFLSAAEDSGLILPINEWALREACRQANRWMHGPFPPVRVAVNVSSMQFRREDLCSLVLGVLHSAGLPPSLLELELTETILLEHAQAASAELEELRRRGVRLAIDDFGTGQSSLSHLKSIRVDRLKIDRSFVHGLDSAMSDDAVIVRAIVGLGRDMNIEVLAEGVETAGQARYLQSEGCDLIQGFYYSPPLSVAEFEALLKGEEPAWRPTSSGMSVC